MNRLIDSRTILADDDSHHCHHRIVEGREDSRRLCVWTFYVQKERKKKQNTRRKSSHFALKISQHFELLLLSSLSLVSRAVVCYVSCAKVKSFVDRISNNKNFSSSTSNWAIRMRKKLRVWRQEKLARENENGKVGIFLSYTSWSHRETISIQPTETKSRIHDRDEKQQREKNAMKIDIIDDFQNRDIYQHKQEKNSQAPLDQPTWRKLKYINKTNRIS